MASGAICDHHYDPCGGCEGVYGDDGRCDQCGRARMRVEQYDRSGQAAVSGAEPKRKRIRIDLPNGAHMDTTLEHPASPETVAALRQLGEIVARRMHDGTLPEPRKRPP